MNLKKVFQCRWLILLLIFILLLFGIITNSYRKDSSQLNVNSLPYQILQINDREPNYKLVTSPNYQFPLERHRALIKLFSLLQIEQSCREYPNRTILDIGASLGEFGLYARACGCEVYMFEINPQKLIFLEKSIKINSFQSGIHLIQKAVTDIKDQKESYFSRNTSSEILPLSLSTFNDQEYYKGQTILLNEHSFLFSSIKLLRIDVQGYELHVLRSTEKFFREKRIDHLIFEYTPSKTTNHFLKDIFNYIKDILGGEFIYALHPKEPLIFGPLNDQDIQQFYSLHFQEQIQRDIYVSFNNQKLNLNSTSYSFPLSF